MLLEIGQFIFVYHNLNLYFHVDDDYAKSFPFHENITSFFLSHVGIVRYENNHDI